MTSFFHRFRKPLTLALLVALVGAAAIDTAEARRAGSFGSFGSRGATRTYTAPPTTPAAPNTAAPIQRTMTPQPAAQQPGLAGRTAAGAPARSGLFGGGFLGSMLGGLAVGGLIGMLLGHGFGGGFGLGAGLLGGILQLGLLAVGIYFLMRFLRRRQEPAMAGGPGNSAAFGFPDGRRDTAPRPMSVPPVGGNVATGGSSYPTSAPSSYDAPPPAGQAAGSGWAGDEIGVDQEDLDTFERLLKEIQTAYGAEDFAALRARTTPEAMGFLAEELGQNATRGLKNDVKDVELLNGDVAEAWREGDADYVTVGLHYSSRDVMRDRATGAIVEGVDEPSDTHEVWTFVRSADEPNWKLAAIQQA